MKRIKKTLIFILALQMTFSHAAEGGNCSFESQLAPDEQALLENVKSALNPMSNNPACQGQVPQIKTFEQALTVYNQQASALNTGGISCMNYEGAWNSRFDTFANNWNAPMVDPADPFNICRGKPSRDEAIQCAALVTSAQKSSKKNTCDSQRDSLNTAASNELRNQTIQTGLTALNDVFSNPECVQSAGERQIGLVQSAIGLAGQAATIAMLGTGMGLLVAGAAQLVNAAVGNMFRNPSRQAMAILDNRENFSKVACLYEQIENKALRCERITASRQVDVLKNMFDTSSQFCQENQDVLRQNDLMTNIDQIIKNLSTPPAVEANTESLSQEKFDSLVEQLNETFPGSDVTKLGVAEHSAHYVSEILNQALESDESLLAYLSRSKPGENFSGTQLRREHRELQAERDRALAVRDVIVAMKNADAKGTQMTIEDLKAVETKLKEFDAGNHSFTGAFNQVMMTRATVGDNLGDKLAAFNSRLDDAQNHRLRVEFITNLNRVSTTPFEDGGRFMEARDAVSPHLKKLLIKEMDTLIERVKDLEEIRPGNPDRALQETLRTQEESVIYPILRACNQLRTIMAKPNRTGELDASVEGQPSVCRAFQCQSGLNSFEDYLQSAGVSGLNLEKCDANCRSHYDRFVCQERSSLTTLRGKVRIEFLNNGTICGKSIRDAFHRASGPK